MTAGTRRPPPGNAASPARAFAVLIALFLCAAGTMAKEIALVHVNDIYQIAAIEPAAPRGGLARLSSLLVSARRDNPATLFLFGGDTLSPSVESGLLKGRQMIAAWNALRLDFAVPGNHEFDFGDEVLRERLAESRFTWLAANLRADPPLPRVQASAMRVLDGVRIGIVGLLTPDVPAMSSPGPGLSFEDPLAAAAREAGALRRDGADLVVALTHCSLAEDRRLAASGLFDLVLGGHDHHLVTELAGRTPILKAGSDARDAIRVSLRFDAAGTGHRLQGMAWEIIPVDGRWPEDPAVAAVADRFAETVERLLGETVAHADAALDARGLTVRRGESAIGNFTADAVRAAMGGDVALLNAGSLRSDRVIAPGPLSRRDILGLLPFQNPLVLLSIRGSELRAALEHGIEQRVARGVSGALPLVSGLRLAYDTRRPSGSRITEISVGGRPLAADRAYTLATNAFLAGGGDGYRLLKTLPVLRAAEGSPIETEALIAAMARAGRVAPAVDGRFRELP